MSRIQILLWRFLCTIILCTVSVCTVSAQTKTNIQAGGNLHYPPFEFMDDQGLPDGFSVDIFKALMRELGCQYDIKLDYWNRIAGSLENRDIDVVVGVHNAPEQNKGMRLTMPICRINRNFVTRTEDDYRSFSELQGKRVAVEAGSWFHKYLQDSNINVQIIENNNIAEGLERLVAGGCDAVLTSELVAHYTIRQLKLRGLRVNTMGIEPQNYAFAVNEDNELLLEQLNQGLQRIKTSGVYDQIYSKWFGIYESERNRTILFTSAAIFLFVAGLLIAFVWLLRRKVEKATRMLNYSKQEVEIAIDAGRISAWSYVLNSRRITPLHGSILEGVNLDVVALYRRIHPLDAHCVKMGFMALTAGEQKSVDFSFRIKMHGLDYQYFDTKMLSVEATKELPNRIVGTLKEITQDVLLKRDLEDYHIKTDFIVKTNEITLIQYKRASKIIEKINNQESNQKMVYTVDEYLAVVHPDDRQVAQHFIDEMNAGVKLKIEAEYRLLLSNGQYDWFSVASAAFQYDDRGRITSYIGMRRNNTKWKNINNELIVMTEKAEVSSRLRSAFLANMSHEIRTPLNAIIGFSEMLMEASDQIEQKQYMSIIYRNNDLLLQLVNDVLELSGFDSGKGTVAFSPFDFSTYFDDVCISFTLKETPDVRFIYENNYEGLIIYSDQKRISQLMTNFVNNAFKFTTHGSVTVSYVIENEGIRVSVTDTGIGISESDRARIFRRFEKVNEFVQGTGLGLSICKEIVEALGGQIGVESEVGKGSAFWFWIPTKNPETD